ncbi:hypothetical protein HY479_02620 [Candidatus Uhrbacteria bacterium]|nr:hypothetical protein [Candidatus Uhrbacteria bacterium]
MKKMSLRVAAICGGLFLPMVAFAAFVGPSQSPPMGNVPGVVWNIPASDATKKQTGTEYNVAGAARIGDDLFMSNSKALRVDAVGKTSLNLGNWDPGLLSQFKLNVIGDIKTDNSDGAVGRVSAYEFCYQDVAGNPTNCITDWPSGGGPVSDIWVDTAGDVMTGLLNIAVPGGYALLAQSQNPGGIAIQAQGNNIGGYFQAENYPVYAKTATPGSGTAVYGLNGQTGAVFSGTDLGVKGTGTASRSVGGSFSGDGDGVIGIGNISGVTGGTKVAGVGAGVYGYAGQYGGHFTGFNYGILAHAPTGAINAYDDNNDTTAYLASGVYGLQAYGELIGVYGSGPLYGVYGIDNSTSKYGILGYGNYSFYGNSDIEAPNNVPSSCATTAVASGAGTFQCPSGKFMSGVRKNASNVVDGIVCCEL